MIAIHLLGHCKAMTVSIEQLARLAQTLSPAERAELLRCLQGDGVAPEAAWLDAAESRYRRYRHWLLQSEAQPDDVPADGEAP